jgi:hypothetical protein
MTLGPLKDSRGDWSSSRLIAMLLGAAVVAMAVVLCVVALRDSPNSSNIVAAIAASLVPLGAGIVGVMWKRSE